MTLECQKCRKPWRECWCFATDGLVDLSSEMEAICAEWAKDDRLWTTGETVKFNLRTFARAILAAKRQPSAEPAPSPATTNSTKDTLEGGKQMPKNAVQWKGDNYDELLAFVGADISFDKQNNPPVLLIGTRGGVISAESGDWVVKADNGDFSVSKEGK